MSTNECNVNKPVVHPAIILIPDISGFTQYMGASLIAHSQVNIARLLESVIDANVLDLSVSEIEGDAILFYKFYYENSANDILEQVKKMYLSFHQALKDINESNDCKCGACDLLYNLSLKFVVHYGEVGSIMIKDHCKLFGGDVIAAHRLLKNRIPQQEYVLFTESFINRYQAYSTLINREWIKLKNSSDKYDVLGVIDYHYSNLEELKEHHKLI